MKYQVELRSVGNPDMGQNPNKNISTPKNVNVDSYEDASQICRNYIEENNLGGGNWTGGAIINKNHKVVAYISYNGRIWKPEDKSFPTGLLKRI